jgi:ABC-type antimicrobial peptide transport system permease subunit
MVIIISIIIYVLGIVLISIMFGLICDSMADLLPFTLLWPVLLCVCILCLCVYIIAYPSYLLGIKLKSMKG